MHCKLLGLALLHFLFTVAAPLSSATAAEPEARKRPPNILFLISDDQRPDTIHALGNRIIKTPNLDALVRSGTVLTRATCAHPLCVPSRAELLTGCTGFKNGVHPPLNKPDLSLKTWPDAMREAGYNTWWVGKWHIQGRPSTRGFTDSLGLYSGGGGRTAPQYDTRGRVVTGYRGWVFQTDDRTLMREKGIGLTPDISAKFADAAIELINRKSEKPFFLQVNFTAPHDPLLMPPGYEDMYDPDEMPIPPNFLPRHPFDHGNLEGRDEKLFPWPRTREYIRQDLATYYAVISHMDEQIGRILKTLESTGQAKNTIVIFASDHGLALGSHGLTGKQNMYEHTINIPLIFRGPGIPAGERRAAQCYLRDLFPTACELTGTKIPASVEGKSLAPVLSGKSKEVYPFIVGYFLNHQRMIRDDRWKLVRYPGIDKEQLFDLQGDPFEMKNLVDDASHKETADKLRGRLAKWLADHGDPLQATAEE